MKHLPIAEFSNYARRLPPYTPRYSWPVVTESSSPEAAIDGDWPPGDFEKSVPPAGEDNSPESVAGTVWFTLFPPSRGVLAIAAIFVTLSVYFIGAAFLQVAAWMGEEMESFFFWLYLFG